MATDTALPRFERAGLVFRPAELDDAAFAADVWTALRPHSPVDPVVMRYWWEVGGFSTNWIEERFVVESGSRPIGLALMAHPRWEISPDRRAEPMGDLLPDERTAERLDLVIEIMEERARRAGGTILRTRARDDDLLRIEVLQCRGYREDRRGRGWELDLVAERDRIVAMTEASRARMREQRIRLLTMSEISDPEKYAKVWRLGEEAVQDTPTTLPHIEESFEDYLRWFRSPDMHEDRFWIAMLGEEIVGVSVLSYPPVRGFVGTSWTGTARSVRGQGVARALKCETLVQAIALGVTRVRTGNDAANAPILHINETMGYRPIGETINFLRSVEL